MKAIQQCQPTLLLSASEICVKIFETSLPVFKHFEIKSIYAAQSEESQIKNGYNINKQ